MGDYETAREELRVAELALMQQRESVGAMRRDLPAGPVASDYTFNSPAGTVQLGDLISDDDRSLVLYHFMFGGTMPGPCPMCSMWADGWNAVAHHLGQRVDFALVTQASVAENKQLVADRGWDNLQWLSGADNSFKTDYGSQDAAGNQQPFITVFEKRDADVRLTYSGGAQIDPEHWRGVDLLSPVWHFFDMTRQGRGDFMPGLAYS